MLEEDIVDLIAKQEKPATPIELKDQQLLEEDIIDLITK